jgi:hypothetical protein
LTTNETGIILIVDVNNNDREGVNTMTIIEKNSETEKWDMYWSVADRDSDRIIVKHPDLMENTLLDDLVDETVTFRKLRSIIAGTIQSFALGDMK